VMKRYTDAGNVPTEHAQLDDNGDGRGSELQEFYLPPELGGRPGKPEEPRFAPKDDGALASRTWIKLGSGERPINGPAQPGPERHPGRDPGRPEGKPDP
jgi:hypothetical protein